MDLYRGKEYFRWNTVDWAAVLETAMNYGWQPMGTGPPRGCLKKDWDGGNAYYGNEGQLFYARDTKNLGTALEIFLSGPETPQLTRNKRQRESLFSRPDSRTRRIFADAGTGASTHQRGRTKSRSDLSIFGGRRFALNLSANADAVRH